MTTLPLRLLCILLPTTLTGLGQTPLPAPEYQIYAGSTHSHTSNTWSHGVQWDSGNAKKGKGKAKEPALKISADGVSQPSGAKKLKPDWQKLQGPPSAHYALAKSNSFDFYVVSDHSQESTFHPTSPTNAAWLASKREAVEATDSHFVALPGYEHSENNGPDGKGHLNVINSADYLNALEPGVDLAYLYKWLKTARPNGEGPVVASFNHPGAHQYNDWAGCDPEVANVITMLEVLNSGRYTEAHYQGFINALDKGWKVAPVCGLDNHGLDAIKRLSARTFVLATNRTKVAILDAMKHRRVYASLDKNLQCRYTVNGAVMGSTLQRPAACEFDIFVTSPDSKEPRERIAKLDIVKDGGAVAETFTPAPAFTVRWKPLLKDNTSRYFFVRVYTTSENGSAESPKPVAWLAPVWTGR